MKTPHTTHDNEKPLAGYCQHAWQPQESPYAIAQLCKYCKLFRYKATQTADWEYRAPIPFPAGGPE